MAEAAPTLTMHRRRRISEYFYWAVLVVVLFTLVRFVSTNENLRLDLVGDYLFSPVVLDGVKITLFLTAVGMLGGTVLGLVLAIMRISSSPVLRAVSATAVYASRSIPLLVQLLFWYFLASILPTITVRVPFGPDIWSANTNQLIGQIPAALIALSLFGAGYMAEIIRSGLMAVDRGQVEAAASLGMTTSLIMRRVTLPQATKIIIPPTINQFVSILKYSGIVMLIGVGDLMFQVSAVYGQNFQQIPLLIVATLWYGVLTGVLTIVQHALEKHFNGEWILPRRSSLRLEEGASS
ncbi:amino acid ABC transporter permease [Arthrobacter sp. RIT-PI-e]|uniref:amino acid ABC transporter permease n=1 Tax=Arthrobacter sp. RIT-PI-e TaxID=1681197 RepID=UPI001364D8FE|nr:amino acid ABC transporter permease [Arthrobacter sp. RIT-PI-e]